MSTQTVEELQLLFRADLELSLSNALKQDGGRVGAQVGIFIEHIVDQVTTMQMEKRALELLRGGVMHNADALAQEVAKHLGVEIRGRDNNDLTNYSPVVEAMIQLQKVRPFSNFQAHADEAGAIAVKAVCTRLQKELRKMGSRTMYAGGLPFVYIKRDAVEDLLEIENFKATNTLAKEEPAG